MDGVGGGGRCACLVCVSERGFLCSVRTRVCSCAYWDVESCVLGDVPGGMCVCGVEWSASLHAMRLFPCVGAQMLGMCASVLGSVWLWVGACVHVFGSLFGEGGCGMRCVCSALSPGQGMSLLCPPTDAEGLSSVTRRVGCLMTLRSCNFTSAVTCGHSPENWEGPANLGLCVGQPPPQETCAGPRAAGPRTVVSWLSLGSESGRCGLRQVYNFFSCLIFCLSHM